MFYNTCFTCIECIQLQKSESVDFGHVAQHVSSNSSFLHRYSQLSFRKMKIKVVTPIIDFTLFPEKLNLHGYWF